MLKNATVAAAPFCGFRIRMLLDPSKKKRLQKAGSQAKVIPLHGQAEMRGMMSRFGALRRFLASNDVAIGG
jgi:hypothetical protein